MNYDQIITDHGEKRRCCPEPMTHCAGRGMAPQGAVLFSLIEEPTLALLEMWERMQGVANNDITEQ